MLENVLKFPTIGKAITLEDQGVYFSMNPHTGLVHSIFRLDYEQEWYLHQLQQTGQADEFGWVLMANHANDTLKKMTAHEVRYFFSRPEFAEPKGAWQVLRNHQFGFGKFTAATPQQETRFALMTFQEHAMGSPILIVKADEANLQQAQLANGRKVEFA
jgi:hypothetical protein